MASTRALEPSPPRRAPVRAALLAASLWACAALSAAGTPDAENRGMTRVADAPPAPDFGRYHALVIGVNDYAHWPRLKFAEGDANGLADILRSEYGFAPEHIQRVVGQQATRKAVLTALRSELERLSEHDNLLVYYAGHGQLDALTEKGYWIPVDGDLYDQSSWIPFSTITDYLAADNVRAKNIVVITDSCYGGALARAGPTPDHPMPGADIGRYVAQLADRASKRSRQVLASGGYEQVPDKSMFATLLKGALTKNTYPAVDLELLFFQNIYPQIRVVGQQEPVLARVRSGPDVDGQFVLLRTGASAPVTGAARAETASAPATPAARPPRAAASDAGRSGGIAPPPVRPAPVLAPDVLVQGRLVIPSSSGADLDTGSVDDGDAADLRFLVENGRLRLIETRNGAVWASVGTSPPRLAGCRAAGLGGGRIAAHDGAIGGYVCMKTTEGHLAQFEIQGISTMPGELRIEYTTWR